MKYVEPEMEVVEWDEKVITTITEASGMDPSDVIDGSLM